MTTAVLLNYLTCKSGRIVRVLSGVIEDVLLYFHYSDPQVRVDHELYSLQLQSTVNKYIYNYLCIMQACRLLAPLQQVSNRNRPVN